MQVRSDVKSGSVTNSKPTLWLRSQVIVCPSLRFCCLKLKTQNYDHLAVIKKEF